MKLYELSQSYQEILNLIDNGEDLGDTLESLGEAIEVKVENIAKLIRTLEVQNDVIREEEKRLYERRRSVEAKIVSMKLYVERELRACGLEKVKGQLFTVSLQRNAPSVEIVDESLIPEQFTRTVVTVDKRLLLEALKEQEIAGATLKQSESVRIR